MRTVAKAQYTIRGVPPAVDKKLREASKRSGRSLNEVALDALARGIGATVTPVPYRDVGYLVGSWKPEKEVIAAFAAMRAVDPKMWR